MEDEIRLIGSSLAVGDSDYRTLCPKCEGGRNNERSFSITKKQNGVVFFNCHRVKCGYSGRVLLFGEDPVVDGPAPKRVEPSSPQPPSPRHRLVPSTVEQIGDLYGIEPSTLFMYGVEQYRDQVCVPIWNTGKAGWEYRRLPPYGGFKKSMHYRTDRTVPWMAEFYSYDNDRVWLVEDVWSAMKVAQEMEHHAVSLMGTSLTPDKVQALSGRFRDVYLALDKDAIPKALSYAKEYSYLMPNLSVVFLSKDLKYLNREEMGALI